MKRVISLFFPTWPTDRLVSKASNGAVSPNVPLVLKGQVGSKRIITAANDLALQLGLCVGMPISKAQALVPDLTIFPSEPEADAAALDKLALWALVYSPLVCADPPDGLVIDITGAAHLKGGEATLLAEIVDRLSGFGITARAAIADTWGAAHALARFVTKSPVIVPEGKTADAILRLPATALRLPLETIDSLRVLGLDTISQLAAQPRAQLQLRFGPLVGRRLDQIFGRGDEPLIPVRSAELIEVRRVFAEPISHEDTIARYIGILVERLCDALEQRVLGAKRLDLLCYRVDNSLQSVRVGTAQPVRNIKRLTRLLRDKIETIDPGFGIEILTLTASVVEPLAAKQTVSELGAPAEPDVSELMDLLANRVGGGRLYRLEAVESYVPERSLRSVGAMAPATGQNWPADWPRPTVLLARAEPIETVALLPDHPPASFTWRGTRRRVMRADGPERIKGEWWRRDAEKNAVRDYFRVEDETGRRFWIYRAGDGEHADTGSQKWFMHGLCR